MSQRFPPEVHAFIREHVVGATPAELADLTNAACGTNFTPDTMRAYKKNHRLKSGLPRAPKKGAPTKVFPTEIVEFIRANYRGVGPTEMAQRLNDKFGTNYAPMQIKGYYGNHKLNSGVTRQYEKGHVSHNKGKKGLRYAGSEKGWFQNGHEPHNTDPVGTVCKKTDGYLWMKLDDKPGAKIKNWKQLHIVVWEEANGPVPDGHFVIFKDGNIENVKLENLMLVSRAENAVMNRWGLRFTTAEATEAGVTIARIKLASAKLEKKMKGSRPKRRRREASNGKENNG